MKTLLKRYLGLSISMLAVLGGLSLASVAKAAPSDDFVIVVKTANPGSSSDNQFRIPTFGGGYNYNVDCNNDGTNEATGITGSYTCTYQVPGQYIIRIKDSSGEKTGFPRIYFAAGGDRNKLIDIAQWGTGQWTSMSRAFMGCQNTMMTADDTLDLSNVTDMSFMFYGATRITGPTANWDTSNVTNMSHMFYNAYNFSGYVNSWNTSNVTNMSSMFQGAKRFNPLFGMDRWDTSKVTNMSRMFAGASSFNQDIGSWDTRNVTNMNSMFANATGFNQDLMYWNVSSLENATNMFKGVTLSTLNYNRLLFGWAMQDVNSDVQFGAGGSQYSGVWAIFARNYLRDVKDWVITDGGQAE